MDICRGLMCFNSRSLVSLFYYKCLHALCNAHHLRDLQAAVEVSPSHTWGAIDEGLIEIKVAVQKAGGVS